MSPVILKKLPQPKFSTAKVCSAVVGAQSELLVCADLLNQGFEVYRNVSPTGATDLVAIKKPYVFMVQVKTKSCGRSAFYGNDVVAVVQGGIHYFVREKEWVEAFNPCSVVGVDYRKTRKVA